MLTADTKIGPYEVLTLVGAGGMGEVYKAHDPRLDRMVAVKILPESLAADPVRLKRFEQEARLLATLNHPNIVAVHDVGASDGQRFIVSEFLEGKTLRLHLGEDPLPTRKAVEIAGEIAQGLAAAHEKGIVHRDLKPENVFITTDGQVKILDFGLATVGARRRASPDSVTLSNVAQTEPGMVMGTVGYMSPEQVKGEAVDHRSDIFSFGSILYEMISGKRAFHGSSSVETMNAILKEDPPDILPDHPTVPPAIERIVRHCLEKQPQRRFQSARDLAFDLTALTSLSDSSAPQALGRSPVYARYPFILITMLVICAIAGFFLWGARFRHTPQGHFRKLTFQRGYVFSARFAPDHKTVLYSAAWSANPAEVFTTSRETLESRPLKLGNADLLAVSNAGELAVMVRPHLAMGGFLHVGTLAQVNLSGGTAPREIADSVSAADWSPDGRTLALIREVDTRHTLEYPTGNVLYSTANPNWMSHVRISPDSESVAVLEHTGINDDRGSVLVLDRTGRSRFRSQLWPGIYGLAWISKTKLWITATTRDSMRRQLFQIDLAGHIELTLDTPGELTLQDAAEGSALITTNERRIAITVETEGKPRDLSWLDRSILDTLSFDGSTMLFHEGGQGSDALGSVYIRNLDGSPAIRLSDGYGIDLSPDKKWALVMIPVTPVQYYLVPTGPGMRQAVATPDLKQPRPMGFTRDNRGLMWVAGAEDQKQMFMTNLDGSNPQPTAPPGALAQVVSANGRFELRNSNDALQLWDYVAKRGQAITGIEPKDILLSLSDDGQWVYLARPMALPALRIWHINLLTGQKVSISDLTVPDMTGFSGLGRMLITPDGKTIVLSYTRHLSELYLFQSAW